MATRKSAVDSAVSAVKPPISFKEFSKDPVKGLLFIVLIAIGYFFSYFRINCRDFINTVTYSIYIQS